MISLNQMFTPKDAMQEFLWFLGLIAALWLAWFFTGGPAKYEAKHRNDPFIEPSTNVGEPGDTYGPSN